MAALDYFQYFVTPVENFKPDSDSSLDCFVPFSLIDL